MRIAAIRHALPHRRITNAEVIERVRHANVGRFGGAMAAMEARIATLLDVAGTEVRYALAEDETALDIAVEAGRAALAQAAIAPSAVDLLLYAGVGRGWLEPATAPAVQAALGLTNATSFDIMEACASWVRALQVAHAYIQAGMYRTIMIVNAECGHYRAYQDWALNDEADVDVRLASYTIGEAATATIVTGDVSDDDHYFTFRTFGEHVDLCMIPLPNMRDFHATGAPGCYVPHRFYARSRELFQVAVRAIVDVFGSDPRLHGVPHDIAFGHDATVRVAECITRAIGYADVYFSTHREYGNTVSASIPLGMSLAIDEERLRRGSRALIVVGSAGLTVGFASLAF